MSPRRKKKKKKKKKKHKKTRPLPHWLDVQADLSLLATQVLL